MRHSVIIIDDCLNAWPREQQDLVLEITKQAKDPQGKDLVRIFREAERIYGAFRDTVGRIAIDDAQLEKPDTLRDIQKVSSQWLSIVTSARIQDPPKSETRSPCVSSSSRVVSPSSSYKKRRASVGKL